MSSLNNCSPVLQKSEIDPDYVGYKIMNADGTLSNPTNVPQMTLRSKSINNAKTIIENGNNSNIQLSSTQVNESFDIQGNMGLDLGLGLGLGLDLGTSPKWRLNNGFLIESSVLSLLSFTLLFGIIYFWKRGN